MGSEKAKRSGYEDPQGGEKRRGQGRSVVVIDEWKSRERSREPSREQSGEPNRERHREPSRERSREPNRERHREPSRERSREVCRGRSGELSWGNREMGAQRGKDGKAAPRLTGVNLSRLTRREKQAVVLRGIFSEHTTDDQLDALVGVLVTTECV